MVFWRKRNITQDEDSSKSTQEVKDYYESSPSQNMGVAWLLAFGTLVLTIVLALGLFFGGRWAFRKITHRGTSTVTITQQANENSKANTGEDSKQQTSSDEAVTNSDTGSSSTSSPSSKSKTPDTGPGNVIAVFVLTSVVSAGSYYVFAYQRKTN